MVKSCLINAFLCTVMTDGLGSLDEPAGWGAWVTYRKWQRGKKYFCFFFFFFLLDSLAACKSAPQNRALQPAGFRVYPTLKRIKRGRSC